MKTVAFQQTRVGGKTDEHANHDEIIRIDLSSIKTFAPKFDEVVAQ